MTAASRTPAPNTVPKSDGSSLVDRAWFEGTASTTHTPVGVNRTGISFNATTAVLTFDPAATGMAVLYYYFVRAATKGCGRLTVLVDASSPNVAQVANTSIGSPGITFSVSVAGGIVSLNVIVDNSSSNTVSIELYGHKVAVPS